MTAPATRTAGTEVVLAGDTASLEAIDPGSREAAVTAYLSHARDQLALAVGMTGPAAIAALKAEIATAAEATKQLGLSKEIQTDAQEMVRRAEFALGKAIRAAQERGDIATRADSRPMHDYERNGKVIHVGQVPEPTKSSPSEFFTSGQAAHETYALVDGVSHGQFEEAIKDAREEGNLSRANVIRKIKDDKPFALTTAQKVAKIAELAPSGMTSGQIADEIGMSEDRVRFLAKQNAITIGADEVMRGTRRLKVDYDHVVEHLVITLEGLMTGLDAVDIDSLDDAQMQNWADSLTTSTRALNRFVKQIKEKTQ